MIFLFKKTGDVTTTCKSRGGEPQTPLRLSRINFHLKIKKNSLVLNHMQHMLANIKKHYNISHAIPL